MSDLVRLCSEFIHWKNLAFSYSMTVLLLHYIFFIIILQLSIVPTTADVQQNLQRITTNIVFNYLWDFEIRGETGF